MVLFEKEYSLSFSACDEISAEISEFCAKQRVDSKDVLRYRLSAEEALLNWIDRGCEGRRIRLTEGRRFFSPYIVIEMDGPRVSPEMEKSEEFGDYCNIILINLNQKPAYSYSNNRNTLYYRIKKKSISQFQVLCIVTVLSILTGVFGNLFIPQDIRCMILDSIIDPIYNTFFNVLGCIAGPMIFLSVAWGIYGIGDVETLGTIGRTMIFNFLKYVSLAAAGCVVFFSVFGNHFTDSGNQVSQIRAVFEMILNIFPATVVEPFATGNTLQIIFLAVVIGVALLYMQKQTREIAVIIGQINMMVNFLMGFISRIVPFVIFMVLVSLIWSGNLSVVTSVWKFVAAFMIALPAIAIVFLLATAACQKVKPSILVHKCLPTFLLALTSASSAAAFSTNVETCKKQFGIDPSLVSFGVPLGIVVHKPTTAAYNLIIVMYFASVYHVQCTPAWLFTALFLCIVVSVSAPPIPGGGTAAYTILFKQLGIPDEALAVALTLDIITDFLITALDTFNLQMALINISSKMNLIDKNTLRNVIGDGSH